MGRQRKNTENQRLEVAGTLKAMAGEYANVTPADVIISGGEITDGMGLGSDSAGRARMRQFNSVNSVYNFQNVAPDGTLHWNVPLEQRQSNWDWWTLQSSLQAGNAVYASYKSEITAQASAKSRKRARKYGDV